MAMVVQHIGTEQLKKFYMCQTSKINTSNYDKGQKIYCLKVGVARHHLVLCFPTRVQSVHAIFVLILERVSWKKLFL